MELKNIESNTENVKKISIKSLISFFCESIPDKINNILNSKKINNINELSEFLNENLDNITEDWLNSEVIICIFKSKNINRDKFKTNFAYNIINYFIQSSKWWNIWDCPYLRKFIKYLHINKLWVEDINSICMELRYSIKSIINSKIKNINLHDVYYQIDDIMTNNINWVLKWYTSEVNELKETMKEQLIVLKTTLNQLKEKNIKLNKLSNTDELTKIANRRYFNSIFKKQLEISKRNNSIFSLIVIDIDHFKNINDSFGHDKWDIVLKLIAQNISNIVRESDTYARYWWEEFIILLPDTNINWWLKLAEKINKSIKNIKLLNDLLISWKKVIITVSQWLTEYNWETSTDEIFKKADLALYEAKETWRDKICINK